MELYIEEISLTLPPISSEKGIFFASDFHLPIGASALRRFKEEDRYAKIDDFFSLVLEKGAALFILGDLFDLWIEWEYVIPKASFFIFDYLHKIAVKKIPIYLITGNRDQWMTNYFKEELHVSVYHHPILFYYQGHRFIVGHGDTWVDHTYYQWLLKIYQSSFFTYLNQLIHPEWSYRLFYFYKKKIKKKNKACSYTEEDYTIANQKIIKTIRNYLNQENCYAKAIEFYIFGHTHAPHYTTIQDGVVYCNTGDWVQHRSYAFFNGTTLDVCYAP